jgi:hypothetical protein
VQRLKFEREFVIAVTPRLSRGINPRGAIAEFYCGAPRGWTVDSAASALFCLQFFRGEWIASRWLQPLQKTFLARVVATRHPLPPPAESEHVALSVRPAELRVSIVPEQSRIRVSLDYRIYFAGGRNAELPGDERRRWKTLVDEDVNELRLALTTDRANW